MCDVFSNEFWNLLSIQLLHSFARGERVNDWKYHQNECQLTSNELIAAKQIAHMDNYHKKYIQPVELYADIMNRLLAIDNQFAWSSRHRGKSVDSSQHGLCNWISCEWCLLFYVLFSLAWALSIAPTITRTTWLWHSHRSWIDSILILCVDVLLLWIFRAFDACYQRHQSRWICTKISNNNMIKSDEFPSAYWRHWIIAETSLHNAEKQQSSWEI